MFFFNFLKILETGMKIKFNSRVVEHLGADLITADEIAFSELIKNSYDASATDIRMHFLYTINDLDNNNFNYPIDKNVIDLMESCLVKGDANQGEKIHQLIVIEDNGTGMTAEVLEDAFCEVGTRYKEKESKDTNKIFLGSKGLGRLSTQRISKKMFIETKIEGEDKLNFAFFDWEKIAKDTEHDIPLYKIETNVLSSYTRIWMVGIDESKIEINKYFLDENENPLTNEKHDFTNVKINENLLSTISFIYSPFAEVKSKVKTKIYYNNFNVEYEMPKFALELAEAVYEANINNDSSVYINMEIRPWFIERIHRKNIDATSYGQYLKTPMVYLDLLKKYKNRFDNLHEVYSLTNFLALNELEYIIENSVEDNNNSPKYKLLPINVKLLSFKREQKLFNMAHSAAKETGYLKKTLKIDSIKKILNNFSGIKLYRNNYRIGTIGNKNDDWLSFQFKRTTGQQFYRFELGNIVGYININDEKQKYINETSSREGMLDSKYKFILHKLLDKIINEIFYTLTIRANELVNEILKEEKLIPKKSLVQLQEETKEGKLEIKNVQKQIIKFATSLKTLKLKIENPEEQPKSNYLTKYETEIEEFNKNIQKFYHVVNTYDHNLGLIVNRQKEIEIESFNNYKLMANGLITEMITHQMHSIIYTSSFKSNYEEKFTTLKTYLFNNKKDELCATTVVPIQRCFNSQQEKLKESNDFYGFIEKTFVTKNSLEEWENTNLIDFFNSFKLRYNKILIEKKIVLDFKKADINVLTPKGTLLHLFYNLFSNSLYWIEQRNKKSLKDKTYILQEQDYICIERTNDNQIVYYDSGTGVLKQFEDLVFLQFQSGKPQGRGLGMYIIRKLLEAFNAKIFLSDELNKFNNKYKFIISFDATEEVKNEFD